MSQFYQKIDQYRNAMLHLGIECDQQLLTAVTKGLGPSIYKVEAETVSGNCCEELKTIKTNFLGKKLGLFDSQRIDNALDGVIAKMGKANLTGTHMRGAHLNNATLSGANFTGTDLREADLRGTDLTEKELRLAFANGAMMEETLIYMNGSDYHCKVLQGALIFVKVPSKKD